ncbi:MAG: hypothetical protein PHT57_15905, partial [Rhodoferax sp.]|nr:hypothetical protein [Rhodoferax sp.]
MKPILEAMCQHWNYGFFTSKLQKHLSESARCLAVARSSAVADARATDCRQMVESALGPPVCQFVSKLVIDVAVMRLISANDDDDFTQH